VVLVTGSSTGLGKATARCLGRAGAKVAVNYANSASRGEATLAELRAEGIEAEIFRGDVTSESEIDRLFHDVAAFPGFELVIDLERQTVATANGSLTFGFEVDPFRKDCLLNGWDDIGLVLRHADKIREFEARRLAEQPWLGKMLST
jgi:NAD(P)-dependent dehydrogenase (short-subunit alcohol dehydrogenase family)